MKTLQAQARWLVPGLLALGLTALYAGPLRTGFLNDDYLFLEEARSFRLVDSLGRLGALGNYYRPLSRQIYFEALGAIQGGRPEVFHFFNFAVFLGALVLLADLLAALLPPAGVLAGVLYFALLPFQRVALTWVSCSQDLLALLLSLAALALHRRGRPWWATLAFVGAAASKEAALPLPFAALAFDLWIGRRPFREALRRASPLAVAGVAWVAVAAGVRASHASIVSLLRFSPGQFAAGWVHEVQSLLGLDAGAGMLSELARQGPAFAPLALFAAAALWFPRAPVRPGPAKRAVAAFAIAWLLLFGAVTGPVAHNWSGYFYMLCAVGGAALVGLALERLDRWGWIALSAGLLWWHAGSSAVQTFEVRDAPWSTTSHLTSYYFERASALTDTLGRQLRALEPAPAPGTRFFFATLPPWAGFQMGSGALIRTLYRDTTLGSYFYSQFSESTAGARPVRFLYWDGARLEPLYPAPNDPLFQVGGDLLLLDRPAGAAHAFRRSLETSHTPEDRAKLLYWLGWAELWRGRREEAEGLWLSLGARDDSLLRSTHLRAAHDALLDGDSLASQRHLVLAIRAGIGRPEAHAMLGELLLARQPKYGTMELTVATWLDPRDWQARRALVLALLAANLEERAAWHLARLEQGLPEWRSHPELVGADSLLRLHAAGGAPTGGPSPATNRRLFP